MDCKWFRLLALFNIFILINRQSLFATAAPLNTSPTSSNSLITSSSSSSSSVSSNQDSIEPEEFVQEIMKSKLTNQCELDQNRKDLCEICMRFLRDRNVGYLGCCTNFDGIYEFCNDFLNYSFEDQFNNHSASRSNKTAPIKQHSWKWIRIWIRI